MRLTEECVPPPTPKVPKRKCRCEDVGAACPACADFGGHALMCSDDSHRAKAVPQMPTDPKVPELGAEITDALARWAYSIEQGEAHEAFQAVILAISRAIERARAETWREAADDLSSIRTFGGNQAAIDLRHLWERRASAGRGEK